MELEILYQRENNWSGEKAVSSRDNTLGKVKRIPASCGVIGNNWISLFCWHYLHSIWRWREDFVFWPWRLHLNSSALLTFHLVMVWWTLTTSSIFKLLLLSYLDNPVVFKIKIWRGRGVRQAFTFIILPEFSQN